MCVHGHRKGSQSVKLADAVFPQVYVLHAYPGSSGFSVQKELPSPAPAGRTGGRRDSLQAWPLSLGLRLVRLIPQESPRRAGSLSAVDASEEWLLLPFSPHPFFFFLKP